MKLVEKVCKAYDYTTASMRTRDSLRMYLEERNIKYKFIFYPELYQWTFTMWLARDEDFDEIIRRFGVSDIQF